MNDTTMEQHVRLWARFELFFQEATAIASDHKKAEAMIRSKATARQEASMPECLYLAFEQWLIATACLHHAQAEGEVSRMGEWAMWAFVEEPAALIDGTDETVFFVEQPMQLSRFFDFQTCFEIAITPTFETASVIYFSGLYDYARRRTAFKNVCDALWACAIQTFVKVMQKPHQTIQKFEASLGCAMLRWAAWDSQEKAELLAMFFEYVVLNQTLPAKLRMVFCLPLASSASKFTSRSSANWARYALSCFDAHLSSMERAQMMASRLELISSGPTDGEKTLAQMALIRQECNHGKTLLASTRNAAQGVEDIKPYFVWAMEKALPDLLLRGLQTWYQQIDDDNPLDAKSVLFSMPFLQTCSALLCGTELKKLNRNTLPALVEVTAKMSTFLGNVTTTAGADNSQLQVPERVGVPGESVKGLHQALVDAYCPEGLIIPGQPTCQLILPMEGHPIQPIQWATWGRTWPICSSLTKPREDRKPELVLIWDGGALTASMEVEMVKAAFESVGASVCVVNSEGSTPENFMTEYRNSKYDVLWVASHGEFDHWSPHRVKLHLASDGSAVKLNDLWDQAPKTAERRLLVLNVCDGARFGEPGMLPRVGLAAGLSGPTQATISHLWPVRPYPSAAFGAYLAHFVASGDSFFHAYCKTLTRLQKTSLEVGTELERLYKTEHELTGRLKIHNADFSTIETWGSAAFFQ